MFFLMLWLSAAVVTVAANAPNTLAPRQFAVRRQIRALAKTIEHQRNELQLQLDNNTWDQQMRQFRRVLIEHHPHRGRRLQPDETMQCLKHFESTEREVRLSLIGHILYEMKQDAPIPFQELLGSWKKNVAPMFDWSKGLTYHGELQLLAHACVKTVMQTNEGSEKIWNYLDRLEKDYACAQWQGIIKKKIYFKNSENL